MAIPAGTKFGPYEILGLIGAGGMGEVHRARDTRLGRDVAIKTLPAGLGGDADRLRRFEIEAKAASLLSHPGILTVYDVGTADGQPYIVSELLEGENLRERLSHGPISSSKSVAIAAAIADALSAAHARGIVHRDLKPENVFLTRDGRIKVLDFGIAKLTTPEPGQAGGAPTLTILTDVGVAVGTLGYMAPEQVRGEPADPRSDIFALGAVLYEMLGGIAAFRCDSRIQTVNAVLESDPPPLPDTVAPALTRIVGRCLEKASDQRFQTAGDLAFALRTLSGTGATAVSARASSARPARRSWWAVGAAAALSAITAAALWTLADRPSLPPEIVKRFVFQPPVAITSAGIAISPDGTRLVYSAGQPNRQLYLRSFDDLDAKPLQGGELGRLPFFSPDGQWIAFEQEQLLRKVPATGGTPVTVTDMASLMLEGSWTADGSIIIAQREGGLMRVSAEGGTLEPLTTPDINAGEIDHHAPWALPGGALLFTIHSGAETFRIAVRTPAGEQRTIIDDGFFARYLPSGHIVYGRADGLFAAPFDLKRLQLTGPSVLVVENVSRLPGNGTIEFAAAADGTLAYIPTRARDGRLLVWVDRTGQVEAVPSPPRAYDSLAMSADGSRLAVEIQEGSRHHIWMYEFASGALTRLSPDGQDSAPVWSPDGRHITYTTRRNGERQILTQTLDASAPPMMLVSSRNDLWPAVWTPDGSRLLYVEDPPTSLADIKAIRRAANSQPETVASSPPSETQPDLSPDGQWLVFAMFDGSRQIFVRPLAGGTPRQITPDGGEQPRWSRDGREIFFRRLGKIMRIPVQTTPALVVGKPETLFDDPYVSGYRSRNYDVSADGRFLMVKPADTEKMAQPIHIVTGWFEELKRRVPMRP